MHQAPNDLTTDRLIALAATSGHALSRRQIARWHRVGLLLKPEQRSRGKGHGTVSVYPERARAQLLAIVSRYGNQRLPPVAKVAWDLWWESDAFEIPATTIRSILDREARSMDHTYAFARALAEADATNAPEAASGRAEYEKHLRRMNRSWMGPFLTVRMTPLMLESFAGEDVGQEAVNALGPVIGEPEDATAEQGDEMTQTMRALASTDFTSLLKTTTLDALRLARDELKAIAAAWTHIPAILAGTGFGSSSHQLAQLLKGTAEQFHNPVSLLSWIAMDRKAAPIVGWLRGLREHIEGPDAS